MATSNDASIAATQPIGVFDSGLGGLTVLSAIHELLPSEDLIYFGDTARVPYGSKSRDTVIRYSEEILEFLVSKNVKIVIVACNTASAYAIEILRKKTDLSVIGVVEPGIQALVKQHPDVTQAAVIATRSTIKSQAYQLKSKLIQPGLSLYAKACPLLVPLIEEGMAEKKAAELIIREYLDEILRENIEHVILGCTHYPLIKESIKKLYPNLTLIDSSLEAAGSLQVLLEEKNLKNENTTEGKISIYVSDITESLADMEKLFFGNTIYSMEKVILGW
ncbi:MAG: glutamate racemase [Leptospirales bacterium]